MKAGIILKGETGMTELLRTIRERKIITFLLLLTVPI